MRWMSRQVEGRRRVSRMSRREGNSKRKQRPVFGVGGAGGVGISR